VTSLLPIHRDIRRALQLPLYNSAVVEGLVNLDGEPLIEWQGIPFDRRELLSFLSFEIGYGPILVHEIGPAPMIEGSGYLSIVIRTPIAEGEDANDALLGIIHAAYPYATTVPFGAAAVHVDKTEHRGYGSDGPWKTGLVVVNWNIYRRD
jgi:hypothetical protein